MAASDAALRLASRRLIGEDSAMAVIAHWKNKIVAED